MKVWIAVRDFCESCTSINTQFSKLRALGLALVILASLPASLHAQTSLGQIAGTVSDATGGVVKGATLTITETQTNETRTATSDDSGFYLSTNLPIGDYTVEVKSAGFRGEKRSGIIITADAKITANFSLAVGTVTEEVSVTAVAAEAINTTSGELAHVIDTKEVENLPLNGRNYTQLMTLIPGAVVTNPDIFSITTGLNSTNQVVNGNRADSANLTVDGAFNQASGSNGSLINNVGADFIQEVKIETSNFSAEFGRTSGPAFNIVTKSGTNQFHGTVFEYVRNNLFDARPFFSAFKTHLVYNDFGYAVGGPIFKDRLFFFGGEEFKRLRQQQAPTSFSAPSTAMLAGNFAGFPTVLHYPGTTIPIPNNNLATAGPGGTSLITPDGQAIANVYLAMEKLGAFTDSPAGAASLPSNNLILTPANPLNFREDLVRLDYKINDKNNIFGRWISDHNSLIDPYGTFVTSGTLELAQSQTYTANITGFSKTGTTALDLVDIGFVSSGEATFSGTAGGGTLTVTDGTHIAHIKLSGDYLASTFIASSDGHGGTIVVDPRAKGGAAPPLNPSPHPLIAAMAALGPRTGTEWASQVNTAAGPLLAPRLLAPRTALD